jgi:hypothetical protein
MTADIVIHFSEGWAWGWTAIEAIATLVLVAGVAFAALQVKQARLSTNAQIAVELFRELRSEESKDTLRLIYGIRAYNEQADEGLPEKILLPKEVDVEKLPRNDLYRIEELLNKYNMLGGLVNRGIIDSSLAIEIFAGPPALRCWFQLGNYVRKKQEKRGFFCENFEDFTKSSLDYFRNVNRYINLLKDEDNKEDKVIELVGFFLNKKNKDEMNNTFCPRSLKEMKRIWKENHK